MPSSYALLALFYHLARPTYRNAVVFNYLVFRSFAPSTIVNYNLDGLASRLCAVRHRVIETHGTVHPGFGNPEVVNIIQAVRDYDLNLSSLRNQYCVLFEREDENDPCLFKKHMAIAKAIQNCNFVCIIGYSFARNDLGFDDYLSFEFITSVLRLHNRNVFVLDPNPAPLAETIAEKTKSREVHAVPIRWDVLARTTIENYDDISWIEDRYKAALDEGW